MALQEQKKAVFRSEALIAIMEWAIGGWFLECEEAEDENLEHYCLRMWFGMRSLNKLGIATGTSRERPGAVAFSVATSNNMRRVSEYINTKIGVYPLTEKDEYWNPR